MVRTTRFRAKDGKNYSFLWSITRAKTNRILWNEGTQSINATETGRNFGDFKTLRILVFFSFFFFFF